MWKQLLNYVFLFANKFNILKISIIIYYTYMKKIAYLAILVGLAMLERNFLSKAIHFYCCFLLKTFPNVHLSIKLFQELKTCSCYSYFYVTKSYLTFTPIPELKWNIRRILEDELNVFHSKTKSTANIFQMNAAGLQPINKF